MPIYLRTLIGIGSFIAAGFLIAIVGITLEIDSDSMFGVGLVHVVSAIPLYLKARRIEQHTPLEAFLTFFSFALILSGKIMCVFGFVEAFNPADELGASLMINVILPVSRILFIVCTWIGSYPSRHVLSWRYFG